MKIQSVRIKNFRTLKDVAIAFDAVTTFIGPNGTGKSTVLRALDWFFNGKAGSLTHADRCFGSTHADVIEVRVTFCELTAKDRAELGKYAPVGAKTFTAWKKRTADGGETLSANAKSYPPFNPIRAAGPAAEKKPLYNELRNAEPGLGLAAWTTMDASHQAMAAWEAAHPDALADAPEPLQTNFFGFNSGGKMSGLFDYVLVTADLRASEESIDGRSSVIGRILERTIDRAAADDAVNKIVEESTARQRAVYEEKFKDQLEAMTAQLNAVVSSYAPDRAITIAPADVEIRAPRTTFEVSILDGATPTPVERQGHGFQRTLLISALQLLAQSGSASAEGVICLAIEEPELFQHPIQAQTFAKVLRSLADDVDKRMQVAYATHSPYFVEARHFHQVRRLTRVPGDVPTVTVHHATVDAVTARLDGVVTAKTVKSQLDAMVANQLAVALFSHRALLVEGPTETAVFYGLGDRTAAGALEAAGVCITNVGGKGMLTLGHAILSLMGIPVFVLFDADRGFEARAAGNGKSAKAINDERLGLATDNRRLLKYFGFAEEDFPAEMIGQGLAIFEDNLETYMAAHWPEWAQGCADVEEESGVRLKKNQLVYRAATLRAKGAVPAMLTQILARASGA